ncbi:hypothetical protein E0H89_04005, partial [Acinetobacter sp. ANC 3781]|uniref:hypothetical protein n=1 Tax=Acinetobacter sp. ANC 3781 TaxID=2529835 RepID=UPI00103879BC
MSDPQENPVEKKIFELIFGIEDNIRNFLSEITNSNEPDVLNLIHNPKYKVLKSYCDSRIPKFKEDLESNRFILEDKYYSYTIIMQLEEIIKGLINIRLRKNSNNLEELLNEILIVAVKINNISKEISMINISINQMEDKIISLVENIKLCSEDVKKTHLEVEERDRLLIRYFEKIDILIYIEKFFLNFKMEDGVIISNEIARRKIESTIFKDLLDDLNYIIKALKNSEVYSKLLYLNIDSIYKVKTQITSVNNLDDINLIINIFSDFKN